MNHKHAIHYVGGKWIDSKGPSFSSHNPATGEVVWKGSSADDITVYEAILSAQTAFEEWAALSIEQRIVFLKAFQNEILSAQGQLAETISKETGKPLWESKGEVQSMANKVDISIESYNRRCEEVQQKHPQGMSWTRHKPHGVIAVFGPFNFPGHLPNGHIVPALLAGNTVIFKPSELAPLTAEQIIQCWEKTGLPKGVINLTQGGRITGHLVAHSPDIDGLFFTGSWETGKQFSEHFASFPEKILALEMGGNNPLIIHQSKNHKATAYLTIQSAFLTAGQRCTCARRLIVLNGAEGKDFLQTLTMLAKRIKVGAYTETPEPFMGPVINEAAVQKLLEGQSTLIAKGGVPLLKMQAGVPGTAFLTPGLMDITAIKPEDRSDSELFGPFLQIIRVENLEEGIKEANRTAYGLSAGIVTEDPDAYALFFKKIRAGVVNWNTPLTGASSAAPFGGINRSGNHRPSAYYAADYCSYPVASLETSSIGIPTHLTPGIDLE